MVVRRTYSFYLVCRPTLLTILLACFLVQSNAQDQHFSQYYNAPLYLNPAMTGIEGDIYFGVNYRSQWASLEAPYEAGQFSLIHPLMVRGSQFKHVGGVGLSAFSESAGENGSLKSFGFQLSAAYNLILNRDASQVISFGLQGGILQKSVDFSGLTWGSQYNSFIGFDANITPSLDLGLEKVTYPVINTGVMWMFDPGRRNLYSDFSAFAGFAVSNFNRPNESVLGDDQVSRLPILYKLHGGVNIGLSELVTLSPTVLYLRQHDNDQYNIGAYFAYRNPRIRRQFKFQVGAWYRLKDAMILSAGVLSKNLALGISYDINQSTLRSATGGKGSVEVSIGYRISRGQGLKRFSTPLL